MASYLQPPDLIVYLKADVRTLMKQITLRGRMFEKSIEKKYLERLNKSYSQWIKSYNLGRVLIIESDEVDFVKDTGHFEMILDKINKELN